MILIGERINGMFQDVAQAIQRRDPEPIQKLAIEQTKAGASYLDVNTGPAVDDPENVMGWLVKAIEEVVDTPLAIDTMKFKALEAGVKAVSKKPALINSTTAERKKLDRILPLVKEYGCSVIGLAMNEKGVPKDAADRTAIAMEIVASFDEYGLSMSDLFIDPIILPVNVAQEHAVEVMETVRQVKLLADPAPKTVIGLSNVSQKTLHRSLINRIYLVMAMSAGLDAAIVDVTDSDLMDAMVTAKILLNQEVYSDSFLKVGRLA